MASVENQILFLAYIILAGVIAMIVGMRRVFMLEQKIVRLEKTILSRHKPAKKAAKKSTKKSTKKKSSKRRK